MNSWPTPFSEGLFMVGSVIVLLAIVVGLLLAYREGEFDSDIGYIRELFTDLKKGKLKKNKKDLAE